MGLFGRRLNSEDRRAALEYYDAAIRVTAFQTREADLYNAALMSHMNSLDEPTSAEAMVSASNRLEQAAREVRRRHQEIRPLPDVDLVAHDFAAWGTLYMRYHAWAEAQAQAFVTIAAGREPVFARVGQLMAESEASRQEAEKASQRLMKAVGLNAVDIQGVHESANQIAEQNDWEPVFDSIGTTSNEDLGLLGRDIPFEVIEGIAVPALALSQMSRITDAGVEAFDPSLPYGLLKILILPGQAEDPETANLAITHKDDYRALHWVFEEAGLPEGIGVWVTYAPSASEPWLSSVGIALMEEDGGDGMRIVKGPQQRLDL